MSLAWHYTSKLIIPTIIRSGKLRVSHLGRLAGSNPCIWFSSNKIWEPSASKPSLDGGKISYERQIHTIGLARIGVPLSEILMDWDTYKKVIKMSMLGAKHFEKWAKDIGADTSNWYCSFKDIPISEWKTVEYFDGKKWIDFPR